MTPKVLWNRLLVLATIALVSCGFVRVSVAALTASDTLSDVRPGYNADHTLSWTVIDSNGVAEAESIVFSFNTYFDVSMIDIGDIDLLDDGIGLTLAATCDGSQASFSNNGDDTLAIMICPGAGGAIETGSIASLRIGTIVSGGLHQITNPATPGSYDIVISGQDGYADAEEIDVSILSGTTVTATVPALTGDIRIAGYTSPGAIIYFYESGATVGTIGADISGFFEKVLTGFDAGLHTISILSKDTDNIDSAMISVVLNVSPGDTTYYGDIIMPPTWNMTNATVKRPAPLEAAGQSKPLATINVFIVGSGNNETLLTQSDITGYWSIDINPLLHLGSKTVSAVATSDGLLSRTSRLYDYAVVISADLDNSGYVNDDDLSLLGTQWGLKTNTAADINDDSGVNVRDFGIMMREWQI